MKAYYLARKKHINNVGSWNITMTDIVTRNK